MIDTLSAGDDPEVMDLVFAAVDLADLALPGAKVITTLGKSGAKKVALQAGRKAVRQAAADAVSRTTKVNADRLKNRLVLNQATADEIAVSGFGRRTRDIRRLVKAGPATVGWHAIDVEITQPLQYCFKRFGVSRDTVRRLTGLDARVFMRKDAVVILRVPTRTLAVRIARDAALEALKDRLADRSSAADQDATDGSGHPGAAWKDVAGTLWLAMAADVLPPSAPVDE